MEEKIFNVTLARTLIIICAIFAGIIGTLKFGVSELKPIVSEFSAAVTELNVAVDKVEEFKQPAVEISKAAEKLSQEGIKIQGLEEATQSLSKENLENVSAAAASAAMQVVKEEANSTVSQTLSAGNKFVEDNSKKLADLTQTTVKKSVEEVSKKTDEIASNAGKNFTGSAVDSLKEITAPIVQDVTNIVPTVGDNATISGSEPIPVQNDSSEKQGEFQGVSYIWNQEGLFTFWSKYEGQDVKAYLDEKLIGTFKSGDIFLKNAELQGKKVLKLVSNDGTIVSLELEKL